MLADEVHEGFAEEEDAHAPILPAMSTEHRAELDGQPVFWRSAPVRDGGVPVLYVHGVPESSDMWEPFLAATGGIAVDLPGFGRSGKRGDLDFSIPGYSAFLRRFLELLEVDEVRLVVHDWGAAALGWAQLEPERVQRLVVMDAVPLLGGYEWHRIARLWRTRAVGEMMMGATTRFAARRLAPRAVADSSWPHFDQGTQRAILKLYRWADADRLEAAGLALGAIEAPGLVLWGEDDPYISTRFAHGYAAALGDAAAEIVPDAGHWPWLDSPGVIDRVATFVEDR